MKSPTVSDKFVTKLKDDPNNSPGKSNETGLSFSKITISCVVVGFFVVDVSTLGLLAAEDG